MKSARTGVSALSGLLHVTVIICRCGNFMVRTQISLAVVVLLVCPWLPPHAQGSVVARLRAAGEAQKQSAASTTPDRTDVARRERGTHEPRQLDVADSLRPGRPHRPPAAARPSLQAATRMTPFRSRRLWIPRPRPMLPLTSHSRRSRPRSTTRRRPTNLLRTTRRHRSSRPRSSVRR
jgi:hypothetical protein